MARYHLAVPPATFLISQIVNLMMEKESQQSATVHQKNNNS